MPTIKINTQNRPVVDRENWLSGAVYEIFDKDNTLILSGETDIKGRGNSTWDFPKKPYSLKLQPKKSVLGMPSHKRWALLANFADKTLLRTEVGYKLGEIFNNMAWHPHAEQVNLYMNEEYRGVYQISEVIKIDNNRVNIQEISTSNPNGGFIVECDWRNGEEFHFHSNRYGNVWFNCSDPDENLNATATNGQTLFNIIKNRILNAETVLYSSNFKNEQTGYRQYLDVNSFIDWFLVNEIVKNVDAKFALSVFLYYNPATQKIYLGPIWDFDLGCGNNNYSDAEFSTGWWVKYSPWFEQLFQDAYFKNLVKQRWNEKKSQVIDLQNFIAQRSVKMDKAQQQNFKKWTILNLWIWPNRIVTGSYSGEINEMQSWLNQRVTWLDGAINGL
ncbi:MAG: CotH kinase family protein [Prevotellaceae bacterium]|nr:CotH kinase family protein [Prevotellaceae bacterium]